jgi:hypothetical protein
MFRVGESHLASSVSPFFLVAYGVTDGIIGVRCAILQLPRSTRSQRRDLASGRTSDGSFRTFAHSELSSLFPFIRPCCG